MGARWNSGVSSSTTSGVEGTYDERKESECGEGYGDSQLLAEDLGVAGEGDEHDQVGREVPYDLRTRAYQYQRKWGKLRRTEIMRLLSRVLSSHPSSFSRALKTRPSHWFSLALYLTNRIATEASRQ